MTTPTWHVSGQCFETCSCAFVCPCMFREMTGVPTHGSCTLAMAFKIDQGGYDTVSLDGLGFIVLGWTPEAMGKGNWSVGVIVDEQANATQREAVTAIASGAAGGPMAVLSGLVGKFLGVEAAPIHFAQNGVAWSVTAPKLVDMAAKGAWGINSEAAEQLMHIDNTGHPANDRLGLYRAMKSHVNAFGLSWNSKGGGNNGHQAPFAWRSAEPVRHHMTT